MVALAERLASEGFRKVKPGVFVRAHTPGVLSWVGLNHARRGASVEINPVVGVRHQVLERVLAELNQEDFDEAVPPTAAMNVGYILPADQYVAFIFDGSSSDRVLVENVIEAILTSVREFVDRNVELSALAETLATSKRLLPEQTAYRLPTALLLAGKIEAACEATDRKLKNIGARSDPAATRYIAFARRLNERARGPDPG